MLNQNCINIACGESFVDGWLNLDYSPSALSVQQANLLNPLPILKNTAKVVYSSHFLEHIPVCQVDGFLTECFRITQSGGRIRLVLPDLEELCRSYLQYRDQGRHDQADFLVLEMLDQCVRRVSGGKLAAYYARLQTQPEQHQALIDFVRLRTGHNLEAVTATRQGNRFSRLLENPQMIRRTLEQWYVSLILALLPAAFRQQNISLTAVGEKHAWMYDFYTIEQLLIQAGFTDVQRMTAYTSNILDFPFQPLDVTTNGQPRKGLESMYIEALKP